MWLIGPAIVILGLYGLDCSRNIFDFFYDGLWADDVDIVHFNHIGVVSVIEVSEAFCLMTKSELFWLRCIQVDVLFD